MGGVWSGSITEGLSLAAGLLTTFKITIKIEFANEIVWIRTRTSSTQRNLLGIEINFKIFSSFYGFLDVTVDVLEMSFKWLAVLRNLIEAFTGMTFRSYWAIPRVSLASIRDRCHDLFWHLLENGSCKWASWRYCNNMTDIWCRCPRSTSDTRTTHCQINNNNNNNNNIKRKGERCFQFFSDMPTFDTKRTFTD